jgi:hypothetical protein
MNKIQPTEKYSRCNNKDLVRNVGSYLDRVNYKWTETDGRLFKGLGLRPFLIPLRAEITICKAFYVV